jgi:hypothetical protein
MSKKNKGGKTPSAKAARNLEALKKAKEAAIAAEVKESVVETPPVEEKKVEVKPEPKPTPAPKKTAYESYIEYGKHPHMTMVSQTIKKNDKGVEIITTEWKNTENGETASTAFSASFVKKGDGIDLKKLREQAEKGLKTYYAEKKEEPKAPEKPVSKQTDPLPADPIPEPKKEEKKEEKKPASKKTKKEEVIIPEEVKDPKPVAKPMTKPVIQTPVDRIDANHGIELMKSFENRAAELEKGTELHKAMREQADIMLFVYGKQWVDQCIADGDEAFMKVSESMYNRIATIGQNLLGITVKALPDKKDGQMTIDFKETLETAPEETKEVLEADAKKEKPSDVIPEANATATEEDKIKAIDSILRMKNGMDGNLVNAINFAKGSFPELKDAVPAQVIAFIYSKIEHSTLLAAYANAIMGNLCGNGNIFSAHTWLKARLASHDFNDIEIAQMAKVMLANGLNNRKESDYTATSTACNKLLKQMNDDLINRIINAKTPKDEAKLKISGKFTELGGVQTAIPATKIINSMKLAYGTEQSSKLLKQNMQRIMGLYSDGIKPLEVYVEKSTYVTKK